MTDRFLVVSADAHGTPPPAAVAEYLDPEFRPWLQQYQAETEERDPKIAFLRPTQEQLDLIDKDHLFEQGAHLGWDIDSRLGQMDREGIAAEILLDSTNAATPPFFHAGNNVYPPEVRLAGSRMYHRWAAELMAASRGRIFGTAHPGPCLDMDQTTKDLRWLAANGFRAVVRARDPGRPDLTGTVRRLLRTFLDDVYRTWPGAYRPRGARTASGRATALRRPGPGLCRRRRHTGAAPVGLESRSCSRLAVRTQHRASAGALAIDGRRNIRSISQPHPRLHGGQGRLGTRHPRLPRCPLRKRRHATCSASELLLGVKLLGRSVLDQAIRSTAPSSKLASTN